MTDKNTIFPNHATCIVAGFLSLMMGFSSAAIAEPAENTHGNDTPSLVVPAEEATKEIAPKTQEEVTEFTVPEDANDTSGDGSLAGNFLSSYVAHSQGDVPSAIRYLKESLAKDPGNQDLAGQLLVLELMHGEVDRAIVIAKKLAQQKDHELIVDLLLAVEATKKQDLAKATAGLKSAQSGSFDHIWLPLLLGWMEPDSKNFKPVKPEDLAGAGETVPTFILYHAALLNDYRGHHDIAKKQYQSAIKDLSRAPFRALLAFVQMSAKDGDRETLQQLLIDLDQQRPEMAELLRRELPFLNNLVSGELPQKSLVNTAEEGVAEVLLTMASMLYTLDTSQDIPLYLQLALYLKPDFPTAQLMLGNYYESMDLWLEAGEQYQRIRPTSPLYLKAGLRRAYILEKQGKPEQAEELLDGFIAEFPTSLETVTSKGDLLRNRSDFAGAIPYYDKAISMLPESDADDGWTLYFARGACYERLKQLEPAERDLQKSLALSPKQPEVLNYLGYMWMDTDRHVDEAFDMIKAAYQLAPDQPHIIDSMGWAFLKTGKLAEATALFENAAEIMPNDPTINEHLGDAYWYAGRQLEARYQWQRAMDFAETDEGKPLLEHKIKEGLTTYSFNIPPLGNAPKNEELNSDSAAPATTETPNISKPDTSKQGATPTPVSGAPASTPTP